MMSDALRLCCQEKSSADVAPLAVEEVQASMCLVLICIDLVLSCFI